MIIKKFNNIINSKFLRNLIILASGTAVAQIIGLAASPILSRLFSPEEFGVYGALLSMVGIIAAIGSLKYEMALVIERDDKNAQSLQTLCFLILAAITTVSFVIFIFLPDMVSSIFKTPRLTELLPLALIVLILTGSYNIFNYRLNRELAYAISAKASILQRIATVSIQVLVGVFSATAFTLVLGNIVGLILSIFVIMASGSVGFLSSENKIDQLLGVAKKYRKYPIYTAPQNLISTVSLSFPVFIIGASQGIEAVGSFWFTMRVLHLPGRFLGQAVHQVFFREAAELKYDAVLLKRRFDQTMFLLIGMIAIPTILIVIWGPQIFLAVFGSEWLLAGELSRWLMLLFTVTICNPPATAICQVYERNDLHLKFEVIQAIGRLASLLVPVYLNASLLTVVAVYSVFGALFNLFFIIYVRVSIIK